mmetsp:Transcript_1117/g.2314  ORF Transcript_1117/g.2314 Transcript_1117/m.2314 type:complete len:709 (-) Transcript_1117:443-2569(-)
MIKGFKTSLRNLFGSTDTNDADVSRPPFRRTDSTNSSTSAKNLEPLVGISDRKRKSSLQEEYNPDTGLLTTSDEDSRFAIPAHHTPSPLRSSHQQPHHSLQGQSFPRKLPPLHLNKPSARETTRGDRNTSDSQGEVQGHSARQTGVSSVCDASDGMGNAASALLALPAPGSNFSSPRLSIMSAGETAHTTPREGVDAGSTLVAEAAPRPPHAPKADNAKTSNTFSFMSGLFGGRKQRPDTHAKTKGQQAGRSNSAGSSATRLPASVADWVDSHYPALPAGASPMDSEARPPADLASIFPHLLSGTSARASQPLEEEPSIEAGAQEPDQDDDHQTSHRNVGAKYLDAMQPCAPPTMSRFQHNFASKTGQGKGVNYEEEYEAPGGVTRAQRRGMLRALQRWRGHPLLSAWAMWHASFVNLTEMTIRADTHQRHRLLSIILCAWWDDVATKMMMRKIVNRMRNLELAKCFDAWVNFRCNTAAGVYTRRTMRQVIYRLMHPSMHRAFNSWLAYAHPPTDKATDICTAGMTAQQKLALLLLHSDPHQNANDTTNAQITTERNSCKSRPGGGGGTASLKRKEIRERVPESIPLVQTTPIVDHEEGMLEQDWDTRPEARVRVGYSRGVLVSNCTGCGGLISQGELMVYHVEAAKFHLQCFPSIAAKEIQYLSLDKLTGDAMKLVDKAFEIAEYFTSGSRGYAFTKHSTYVNIALS